MDQVRNAFEAPNSNLNEEPDSGSSISSILIYQFPTILGLASVLLLALVGTLQGKALVPAYKLIVGAIVFLGTSLAGYAMTRFSRMAWAWHSRPAFWLAAILGGSIWALCFNVLLQLVVISIVAVSDRYNGPLALYQGIYVDSVRKVFSAFPYFAAIFTPIHLIYSIRRRRALR